MAGFRDGLVLPALAQCTVELSKAVGFEGIADNYFLAARYRTMKLARHSFTQPRFCIHSAIVDARQ